MRKQLLLNFIQKHPNHSLTEEFQAIIDHDVTEFNVVRDAISRATKSNLLTPSMLQQTDILMARMSMYKETEQVG